MSEPMLAKLDIKEFPVNIEAHNLNKTKQITLKFSDKLQEPFVYYDTKIWSQWQDRVLPLMLQVAEHFDYKHPFFPRATFAMLPAKGEIKPHTDGGYLRSRPHKIHIPISTNPETFFLLFDEGKTIKHHMKVGNAYDVNNFDEHAVVNDGDTDRIHFIFEMIPLTDQIAKTVNNITQA